MPFPEKTRHLLVEDVEWLIQNGETNPDRIAERFGIKPASVARALWREGRADLAKVARPPYVRGSQVNRVRICRPCRQGDHQEHRIYAHGSHKCKCDCSTDNARNP